MQVEYKWCDKLSKDNFKHKLYIVVTFVNFCGGYIQMTFFLKTPKWESQNWDSCCFETLDICIFLKK